MRELAAVSSPLLTVVDASAASTALSKPASRLAVLDTAVRSEVLSRVQETRNEYRSCRQERERLEHELSSRTLPSSFSSDNDEELMSHWIEELDIFSARATNFCRSIIGIDDDRIDSVLDYISRELATSSWEDNSSSGTVFTSTMYESLADFRDGLRSLDEQIVAARNAVDARSLLSATNSAAAAVENARKFLFDATTSPSMEKEDSSRLAEVAERSHEEQTARRRVAFHNTRIDCTL